MKKNKILSIFIIVSFSYLTIDAQIDEYSNVLNLGNQDYVEYIDSLGYIHTIDFYNDFSSMPFILTDSNYNNMAGLACLHITLTDDSVTLEVSSLEIQYMFIENLLTNKTYVMYDSSYLSIPYSKCDIICSHIFFESIKKQIFSILRSYCSFSKRIHNFTIKDNYSFELFFKFKIKQRGSDE